MRESTNQKRKEDIKRLVMSAVMLGVATTLELISSFVPFFGSQ